MIEQAIVPSLEMWAKWEQEGVVKAGGVFAGERGGGFVLEAESAKEVGKLLTSLPFWIFIKWDVKPLQSASSAADRERGVLEQLKAALGG
jgi:Muconolactone delta-isomerase